MPNEADTCRRFVVPKLQSAGWDNEPCAINEQFAFTDGRIIVVGGEGRRRPGKRADYLLRYRSDFAIAVVEAKPSYRLPRDGLQQAKEYAEILGLKFAYATNGHGIVEFDYLTGQECEISAFPTPENLWDRLSAGLGPPAAAECLLTPGNTLGGKRPRYYQEIAINRAIAALLRGRRRVLLTMATGTGKTFVAFQICWKLWSARWGRGFPQTRRNPRILYLADRNILIDDPKDKTFTPFGDARQKIENGEAPKSREMYFAIYQAIARDERRPGLYREYPPDFFDLIIVDECHRGSANDESSWREILEYFEPAYQLGMTATPKRAENADTYRYFGDPVYTYSLRQGIEDGFLAPYRVHRVISAWDAAGWRPSQGDLDRFGRHIPDQEYCTPEFERKVALLARTKAIARHLTNFLRQTNRFDKTIVFCVDQEHANEMRAALNNLNADLVQQYPDYVCRVTADEGETGRTHLSNFQDVERKTPVILTTSQMLSTGVDMPTCKNVVIARVIGSMIEFKQIIGRGTRVRDDHGKLFFNIIDYTGSATSLFADPAFDGDPVAVTKEGMDDEGQSTGPQETQPGAVGSGDSGPPPPPPPDPDRKKFYFDGGQVEIVAQMVFELDADGRQLRVVQLTDHTARQVRTLFPNATGLRERWATPEGRAEVIDRLAERGIDAQVVAAGLGQPEADPFDLLCHLAYNAPLKTRRERLQKVRKELDKAFEQYPLEARAILNELLEKYADHGVDQLVVPEVLEVPPINRHGNPREIARKFGGEEKLAAAVQEIQARLYAA